ncbi:TPA: hyperosmolarity resistance protein Ebh, partial [Staphylococcus aureus]|nr:hyperosmolarity resistance protein Ebh [Staphylococcus aureus]HDI0298613.1 hyperosmolarity resistance protein Ebh [Staphylococcus aureus]
MNYRDKIQKFSIRKYTVGTFSTVIATLVFLGLNTSQAQAAETNQPASALKQKQQNGDTQTENREVEVQNSQNGQSLSAPIENEQPNNNQTNHVDASAVQSSTTEHDQPVSQNEQAKKDTAAATPTQSAKAASKHEQSESRAANKKENDNKATHVESHEANVVTASDSSDSGNVQHDRNELQAFFDANYHDYRFIDRENADSGTFNYVKGIFDKINTLLGSNDPINNKDLQLAYKELEQAVALIRTMPQRQQTSRRSSRIQTRSIESRAAEPRSVSDYQNANSSYYVENANDGSGYPVGTYINASSKGAPYNLPTTPWNTLKASDAKEIALITAKQTGDGYQWVIKFNKGHAPHENMIYWFALPAGQTPVGRTEFVTVNADGTNVQWSNGAGAGANKPLPEMWPYGVNDSRSWDYKIRNRSGQVIYDWPTVHINSLKDLARASDYFSEAGATPATKAFGRQTFEYINGERPTESPGVPKVYTFIGKGDASYTISFKTQGPTIDKLYYAAGGRALEYNQLFMYSQLYVESTQDYQQRLNGLRQVVNRTYRIGTTKRVEVSQGNVQTKKVLESTNLNIDDFMDDPLSYVKTPSNKVLGFYPTSANTNAFRPGGVNPLNEYQLSQLFTDDKLQQAARTGSPIRLMIGFDYPDAFGNGETLVPVNLTVLPEIQHNIKFFKNDDGQNIADKPASKQAGHPVFYVYAGNQGNASVNLGGSVTSIQPLRINLTSNENFTDKDWQITGIPRTLHIENSTNRTNNARERNIELVGNLLPGDYFGTIRFGRKEQLFEIRVKPHTPRITTTAEELRGTALQKVPVTVTDIPLDPSALVYLVIPTSQTRDGGSEADQIPSGYTKIATGTPDGVHSTITIRPEDYVVFIPPVGNQIRALIFYNNVVASNMSNAVTILPDDIPPTINNPVGLNAKYYRGHEVSFTMGVSDRHSGLKSTTITTLPSGWTSNLTKSDKKNGSLAISGRVSMNQAYNSDITFKVSATDNVNNTTNDSQSKHVTVHVGKISDDAHPIVLGNSEKVVVVNPTALTGDEKQRITTAFMNKNQNIRGYLASSNPVTVDNHGNVTLQYRDGSSTTLDATNVMTYEPVVKPEYQTANAAKTATVTIAKGQSFNIGDIKQYFTLSNGQAIPSSSFTNITSDRTIPTAQEVSQMNAGTQLYHIVATNAYHKDTEDFYITLKIIDVKQPEGDQRVYRMSTYDITTDEISKVKQAFINANRDAISFAEGDISVTNTPNGSNVSTITVNINKGRLTKSFTSNLNNMNFLRWVNFPQDYTVTWTNAKIANRPTDGGLSWSDDHKSLIYRYDATLGTQITTNDILTLLKATTTVPGLRNNIAGNEKAQAEAGGRPNYKTTGYSQSNPTSDGQRQFTLNGQVIQIMDIINPSNGFGGQPVTNSNVRANHSNSTVVSVNESAANGAGAFTIDHVVKNNSTHNAADAVYKAQLYLSPYGPKQYVEHLNQNTDNTNEAINIYFVPSDLVNPTISVGNYTNHQVFSGETFTNTITANDNFGVQSVTVPTTSQLTGTVDNNHQHVSATAPNVTSTTNKTINLVATDTSGNTATTSFNVTIKPLRDKYRVGTSSTAANPVRIANISNNATVSQADQTAIINSLTFTSNAPNRNYATASANEITSKTVSNVSRTGNNAQVTVTVTYQDGTTSTVTVPVKRVIPEIVAHSHYTVQGQDFPTGNGASASDYFKLSNGSAIPDATITWVSGQAPNKNNTTIGQDINVTAHILIDGETTPITKTATYKVVRTVPKQVFETARGVLYPGVSDMYDAKQYVKPVNNSWSTNAQHMNFQFTNSYGPSKDVVGISTRDIRVTYDNHQTQIIKILSKVKPDPPRIDGNSVTYKAGLTNQQIKINNVLSSSSIKLFKADNTPLTITNTTYGSGNTAVVTVSDALPNGEIKARSSISMNNVTYTTQDEHGRAIDVTRNESVDSNDSASVHVTPQLQATTEGAVFIKGGDGFDFGHVERFIQNPPHGATVAWHDNPDTWKNTVGNTHKTAVVTLPNGQGTRNVEVPVKVYPVANAKAPSRDVKGQNLTNGTDAINYITFDPNTNTNGITAVWANRQQPNNQQAGVQHLNVDVTYPGISAAKRVPVTVNVYQFEFPQTSYTTTVGGTLASGTQASGYAHIQNATGLPTDGFTYKWNNAATGTNDANWAAMNKPNTAQVINAKYDVIYNGHTFATSLPAKFVVKDVQPAKPTVTETAAGVITIAPGANQTVNTHAGNVTTYADKLVIKRNGNVVTTFTRHNNTSPWVKEASAANVAGIAGTNNGITVAAGTFNPADTIQAVATQGSGETISDEQRSDDFTVVAPQPNQATTKIWQNGHVDITPNNPSGHLINPTQAMDIAYTEKVGNGAEHSKTLNAVRGQNNQWTIANKPDYVTLDAHTGKVTFNANTIKPNSAITITPKAGTGHSASSNPSTLTAPAAHTVNTTEIVKDYGSNVTAAEINNAVQVANKRTATIKNGTAMPTNLAGGSTTTIPVTVTYNDSSTEEVQESIFTKADKRELITAKNHLDDPVSTDGKKPGTITQYNNAIHNAQQQINTAKTEAQQVINDERATPQQVNAALSKVQAAQTKINEAKALLQNKEDNSQLVTSKNNLQSSVNQVPSTTGMTQQSIDNYNAKKREAESEITAAQRVIDNGDATAQQISDEKHRVDNALTALNQAKQNLTADTHELEQAVHQLNRTGTTTGKKPASITAYNNSIRALQSDLTSAKNSANAIIQKPIRSVQEVQTALTNVNRVNDRLTLAINQLVPLADNSALRTAKTKLDEEINKSVTTDGMTQSSIQAYENAKRAGQTESTNAQNVINNGDATDQQIAAKKTKVEEKYNGLKQAIAGLTPDLAPLQAAKTQLQNDIDQPTSTTGMTSASVAAFNDKLSAARTKIQEIDRVLASHPDVATIRQNVTAANATKTALDQARNGLTVDKAPLENAKNQLQQSIDTQTSTTGMTQDSINAYNAKLTAARNKIQQINQVLAGSPTVDQINTNTSAANQAKSDLDHARQALTPDKAPLQTAKTQLEQSINQPTDTTGMTTASLNAYNQKLQAARQKLTEINQVLNGNPTVQNINDKVAEANQAKDQLNTARQGLTLDRQPAFTTLHGASNLNQAQQNNFTQQINAAPNHAALETIKSNITALNNAMTKLKDSVADNNSIKSGQNYTDATTANKQAYDNAVNAAKGVIGETTNPTMDVNTVNQKAETVKSTKGALDGQQNLQRAKTEATNAITHASDLNQTQKNALTQQVNNAQNVQAVNDIKQTTQSLNTAMTGLKRGVANHNQVVQSDNYVNADTNKKNDYNNAYNHANDIINGNAQHPVITPSDVNNALSNVTSKEQALNGEAKLNAAKQEANTALGQLNNLNNAQRQNLQSQINGAHQIETVNTIKQNATNLNSAMGNLRQAVADKEQVKRTEDYADADTAKQNAYNSAVSSAETIINQTTNPTMSVNDVNSATSAVTTNKNALNGDEKLAQSKTDAASAIDALPHLNNAQKADVKSKINAASNIAGVNTVKQQGTDLNTAMGNLQGAINDEQTTLNSQNYQDATPSKKTAYTNAVQAAKDILNKSNGQNKTKDQVTEAMNQVNSAKNNLDGTRLLDQAKQTAKQQLNNMTHLTTAQKTHLTNQINSGTTVAGVHTAQSNANTLDQAMNTLRQSIANKDATKASEDYVDANNDKQTAYNNAVAAAETIINANSNPEMNPSTITQKAEQVNSSKTALNGDENLATAKLNAKTYLNTLTSITDAQKNNLISQISSATRVSSVDTVKQNAQHLDQAMASLQNGINNESQVKSSEKYRDADTNKQQEYDNAITAAKAILNKQHGPNTAQNAVEAALQRVKTAKNALNGDAKLIAAQNAAKQHLGTLTHITTAQRNDLTNQISQATNLAGVESVKQSANSLDGAMGNLQTAINDKSGTLASQNFLDADEQKRNAYNQAVSNAETILNKQTGPNTAKTAVEQALNNVNSAKHALNGTQNLNNAKQAAITAINGASDLNQHQKDALKAQANGAQRVSNAQDVQRNATELNTAMGQLQHAIADKTTTLASSKFVNADSTKQNVYTTKVTNAEHIISGTPTVVTTPSEVTAAANQVNSAKQELNGDERLRVAKQNANTAIDALTQLNTPQKAKLKEQVGQANRLEDVQSVQTNGQSLNNAMKGLRDSIANETTVKASQNYTDASPNNQSTYNSAVSNAKGIINQTNNPTMDASAITQATTQVNNAKNGLNGAENLRNAQNTAKQNLNTLSHLTNNQKSAISSQIDRAGHVSEVTAAKNAATELNTQMGNLEQAIHDQNTVKQGVNFTDADEAKRNAYTNAVTQAEQILNKVQGPNTAKDNVESALQNVQRAKNDLNGNQNVANAKTTAKNTLNNLTSINNAQNEALKSQIDSATTVAGVNQVSATASELNTAMSNLQNGINDEAATKAAQKYTDADSDKQTAYNDAVTAAKTLLDKTAGTNDNKAAVEQALQRVNTAKTALNGDARLNQAKNTAKQQLATMSHLTDAQKANLTSQIERGTTVAGVQGIQANAGTLNEAMNQLRQSIASKDATKASEDYHDANTDLQNAYNDAVTNAEGIISATNNPEMNPDTINQKASQVNSAKSALNGDEKLAAAKQTAKSDIGRLTDLNNAQRTAANAEVDQAPNLAAVTAAKNKATSLNTAMGNLKHALAEKDNTKRSVNYTDADQPKQQAYDTAVTQAEAITNANGSNANETQVQAALNQLNQAKNDLNGDNKVAQAKETAKRALASYSNLNNAQSTAATSQIDNATTVAGVTAAQNTANELNTAMGQLQNGINDQNTVKQQVNFTDADQGKKDAYTNAVTNAQGILDKAHGQNMTKAQVEAALNQVTTAKNALNGDANVRQAKSDAKANLGTLTHLNNAQKQDLTSQIEGATTVNGVNGVKTKAQDLDGAMQRLQSAIANKDQTKASENYIDADPTNKTAFDNAITQAESYLNKDHGANKDKQAVEQAIQSVTSTENALNGDANLQRAKTEATQAIDNLTHLNTPQKTALKQQVNAAQRVSGVTDLKNSATSLNNAMDQLKQAIADHDTIVAGGNYTNASPDKQGAYTDAYNAAKNIVNGSPNVITNAADVTAATQRVNNAETGLNGDTNLATAKQQAKDALRQMTHLSDAQKQSITVQIDNATQVTGVQSVKDNATNLDNAMNQLRNSIANKDEVKASQPYVDADRDKQNAYNTAVTSAENIINATSQPTLDPSAVTQAANQVNTNKTALNGAQNLANKKQETTANINQLSHLNNAQKQDLNTQVTNAPNISTVSQVKTKAEQLDQAMERLINGIQDKDQVKQSVNFTDADPEKQTAYNNAVTAAENIINQANGTNANQSQVEAALSTVTTTKQALNGDRKVTDAKNNANQTLSTLDNLNNAQKGAVTGNINQAHTVAEVTQAIQTAQELNTAMGNLKNSLNDKDTTLGSQNFADADPEKKNAYNEAVRNAENILNKSTGTNVSKDQVEAAMNQVNTTKAALNGTQNLEKAKQHANTAIDGLSHLTNAQKEALKQLVQQSTTVAEAQGNEQKANNVDAAMDKLRQSIADNATTKQNQNYTDSSPNKKDAYNNAVTTAQGIIDQTTSPTLDPTVINQAAGQVSTTKNALNGNENLEAAKQQATQSLGSLDNLNNAQKQAVTDQINGAHTVDEANQIKQNAQNLNTAMGNLKQAIADKDATKATVNFTDADQAKQQAYNTAVTNAENIISKANGGNATQTEVEQAIQQVNAAKQALNGNANVQHAKDEATALINSSNDLNQAQKDALKQQVQNATTVAGVNNVKQTAQELNNAMTQLKQGIADKEQTKADGNFVNADPDKQNAYKQAVAKAEALISGTPDVVVTPSEITAALNKVTQAKNDLNGNTNLATTKQNVQHAIDQLPNLNQAQRDEYSKQITQATLVPNVNAIQQAATTLNDAMTQLKQGIANKAQIKGSENYHDADTDKQTAYDNAVTKAEELLKQTTNPTMDPNTIQQALTKVNDTNQALNGNQKLADAKQAAKTNLGTLDHLNDAQKQALTTQVEQAPDIATVNNVKQNAQNLNNAMTNLSNALQDKTETLNSINFTDADQAKKDAYTNAVAHAEGILSKANGSNASQTEVEQAMQRVNAAKQALNGNDNLANAKQQAKQQLANLTHLNDAQKQSFESQITQAPLVTDVTTINQKAQALDHAMELLRNSVADNQATLASEDYHDATAQRQNDYNQAVTATNNIINQTTSPTMNPDEVNRATTQVNNTKVALDGDENLVAAKQQANNRLDQLDHLNNAQKQQLQSQITQSSDIAAVNGHKQTAESLNTAMGNLINAIADHQTVEQLGNFVNADTDKQTAYTTAVNEAEAMINKQTGQNANQTEVEQAITKVQTTLQALNGDHNLQVAKANATQAIDALTSLNDPQKTALKDQVTAATLVTAVHQIEQNANTLNQAMHGLRESIQDNAATKANSKYINEDQSEQQNYDQAVQAANNIINEQTATLDNNAINQAATTVNTTKAALHGDVKLQNDKDHAKQTVSQLTHLNNAQKHMEDTLIDSETTRTAVNHDLTEAQALDQLMDALQQSIADKDATRASSAYVNAEPNKKQSYDEAVQNAESIIAGLNNPTINKGNVTSATQAVTSSKNALDGVERLAQDKQTAGNSLNHLDQLTPAQQQALENQINNATTRDKVAEIIAQAQALNEAMKALKESIKDQPQTEASSKFINEDQAQKDAYTQAVQHAKDLINKTTDPTLAKSIIDQATQAVTDAKNNLHGDQKLDQDKQRATETLNNLSNLNTPQRQALENQINNAATRGEVAQKLTEAEALNQAMEALRNSIQDQQQTEAGSKFINEDKPQKDAYQAAVQNAKDLINQTNNPTLDKAQVEQLTQAVNQAKDNLHGDQKLADDKQHAVTDLNQLNGLNNPQRQALESQINNAATRDEVAQKLAEAKALDQAMQALRNSIQDQQQTESGSKFINEDKPQKDAYQAAVQNAKDLINQTGNPTLDKSQVEQLTQAVTTAKDNLHGDQKLARDQLQAVTTVNALPNLNHAQQQALTDAINAAPTRTEVAQHVQTATELDHAMETLKNKVDQVNTDKAQPNYTEASTDKKEAVDQALQAAESITDPTNGSNANKDAVDQALTKLQEKVNELNGNERVAEAKTQAKQTIDQLTHLNADQIATAKQNIDQATKLQPIAELVDQATQLNQSMDQLQQAVNEHANVEQTVDYTQADLDKQNAYKQAIADAENVLKQNANKQQVDQALQNILNAKQALNGDERVALAKTNGKHDIEQLNALNNAQQDGFKGRIDQSNDLNQIQQIVDEAKALNRVMDQLSQGITGNEGRTKGSTNYVNADTQVKQVYDEAVDKAKQALDKSTGQNLTAEQVIKLNDAVTAAKKALNGEEKLNNRKSEALQRLDQLTHLNNAQRQLAIQQINNAETLNKASRAINRATKLDNAMGAVQQYIDEQHLGVISSTNYINADDNLKANYDNAIANAAHELDKVQGNAIAKAEAEQLKQNIIDAQNALNGDQNLANAKDKANAFVNSLNGLNQQQQHLAHNAINNADTVSDVTDIVNNQIDLNDAMETLKHLVDNEIPNAEQTVNYQNAEDNAKTNFDDAKRLANTLLNSDNTNVNDINGAIQTVNDAIQNLNGDQRLQDAKDKAIQSINQALANKLKEIEASNATDQDKLIAKNKAEELANSIINNINKATSNQDVSQVQTAGNHAIEQVHANEIPKAKIDANKDVDKQVQALIDEIDRNPILTDKEKQALKDRINQILQQGHN